MAVLLDTSYGEIVIDLYVKEAPIACKNFLQLCAIKYYNNNLFYNVQESYMIQTGDPTGTGKGGKSIYGELYGEQAQFFEDEIVKTLTHNKKGIVAMANKGTPNTNTSQFYITTRGEDLEHLDGKHTIFGEVAEGMDIVEKIDQLYVDENHRPYVDVRINHTIILDNPFPNPPQLSIPPESPKRTRPEEEVVPQRLAPDEKLDDNEGRSAEEIERGLKEKEAKSRAVVLEMIGDIPDADIKPPEEVLFVCKINPVTTSEDLELIFSRFGPCKCDIIQDYKTGDSLCFGFVEFTKKEHCEEAYFKMNNVLVDDRRIKVDFSQSVSRLWNKFNRKEKQTGEHDQEKGHRPKQSSYSRSDRGSGRQLKLKTSTRGSEYDLVEEEDLRDQRQRDSRHSSHRSRDKDRDRPRKRSRSRDHDRHRHRDRDVRKERRRDRSSERRRRDRSRSPRSKRR